MTGLSSGSHPEEVSEDTLEQAAEWLVRLNDSSASQNDFQRWSQWLNEHPSHARAFSECQETWRRSASVERAGNLPAFVSMRADLMRSDEVGRPRGPGARNWVALAAAVTALAVGLWFTLHDRNVVKTATAELRSVRLPDGSRAALGPETRLQLNFSEHARTLKMESGAAYFEVVHAPDRPFSVVTPAGTVVAVGTAFSVNASADRVSVAVSQGIVRVEQPDGSAPLNLTVTAGHRLTRDHARTQLVPLNSGPDVVSWQAGGMEYEGEPLRAVIADINRYSQVKVHIADPDIGELRYTGTVFPDALDSWLASIEGVFPVRTEKRGSVQVIVRTSPERNDDR